MVESEYIAKSLCLGVFCKTIVVGHPPISLKFTFTKNEAIIPREQCFISKMTSGPFLKKYQNLSNISTWGPEDMSYVRGVCLISQNKKDLPSKFRLCDLGAILGECALAFG